MKKLYRENESGAILIVVLGILALLTVIAVSFVFSSRQDMRAAETYMNTVTAGDITEAAFAHAVRALEADKIKRTGDRLDPSAPITESYDSLRDDWRKDFSAPVIIEYTTGNESELVVGDVVVNTSNGATATVIALDTTDQAGYDGTLYLNSTTTALWQVNDVLIESGENGGTFSVTVAAVSKPDQVDLDGDGTNDAVWHNYYDERGNLIGRYAVLIQDESSKINVNMAAGLQSNEGWSVHEISLASGLDAAAAVNRIYGYRYGVPNGIGTATQGNPEYRILLAGQGDGNWTSSDATDFDDDDDNFNRVLYANDGVDNDGDGTIDESDEGINEPEEFRILRPYRTDPLDYNTNDDDNDGVEDESNEGDDQPILALEQLEDPSGVFLTNFLTDTVSTNFAGETNAARERRHFMSTLSWDRNLTASGELRTNLNLMDAIEASNAIYIVTESEYSQSDLYSRTNFHNLQKAANLYDYRDRNDIPTELIDNAGDVFRGVEAVRINEVLVRAATNLYEGEDYSSADWTVGGSPAVQGAITPRGNVGYLTNADDATDTDYEFANTITVTLPNPPFDPGTDYPFKLRIRVRNDGATLATANDRGFRVWITTQVTGPYVVTDSRLMPDSGVGTSGGYPAVSAGTPCRWSAADPLGTTNHGYWYVEEAAQVAAASTVYLSGGDNTVELEKPRLTGAATVQDAVDVDWLYFTLEPDCEWIELVNIGNETVNVANWRLVSEYLVDWSMVGTAPPVTYNPLESRYYQETYEVTLPNVGIRSVDDPTVWAPGPPHYVLFTIDTDDTVGSAATVGNGIDFRNVWDSLENSANIYQLTSIANIYSGWIDFFGNEPLDIPSTGFVDVRDTADGGDDVDFSVEVGRISLYDSHGNLVDSVTYDAGNVAEAFASLQRDYPANPGDRLDANQNFKMRSFEAADVNPVGDYNVIADGAYDDWKFWQDPSPPSGFVGYSPNSRGSSGYMTPATANNFHSTDFSVRVTTAEGRVKNRFFSNVGEIGSVPFFNEFLAVVAYNEGGSTDDTGFSVGDEVLNTTANPDQSGIIVSINPSGDWMIVRGDANNPVNTWRADDVLENDIATFYAVITSVKPVDTIEADGLQFFAKLDFAHDADEGDLSPGDTISNDTQSQTATLIYVYTNDSTPPAIEHYMIVQGDASNLVHTWSADSSGIGDTISSGVAFSTSILANHEVRYEPTARMLADRFTTAAIDLEAAAGTSNGSGFTPGNWPGATDPEVPWVSSADDLQITWDEDGGLEDGTYSLYGVLNNGEGVDHDIALPLGPISVAGGLYTLDVDNIASAADHYFMRAMLSPPPRTFGRINVNTASHLVLQGLPGTSASLTAAELATAIINARNAQAMYTIGDVYRASEFESDFTPAVFRKISNLITTKSDVYKIIVLGQAARDADGNGIIDADEVTSEKKVEMIYNR